MEDDGTPPVVRGLPRPMNNLGLPVPYIAASPQRLGDKNFSRAGEVILHRLCQVCGESIGPVAYAVVRCAPAGFEERIFDGMLHDECARLAFNHCPVLHRWQDMRLFQVAVAELPTDGDGIPIIPRELQAVDTDPTTLG
jgi:hypothetical protein